MRIWQACYSNSGTEEGGGEMRLLVKWGRERRLKWCRGSLVNMWSFDGIFCDVLESDEWWEEEEKSGVVVDADTMELVNFGNTWLTLFLVVK